MTELKITQADDAAATQIAAKVMIGALTHTYLRTAFAHHRIAAEEGKAELVEALELADAALRGANMDIRFVEKKVNAALARVRGEG